MSTRVALIENFGLDFLNFRVPLVKFLEAKGFEVFAIVPYDDYYKSVKTSGIKVLGYHLRKNTFNPFSFIRSARTFSNYNKKYKFSIVHAFRLQPNIISSLVFAFNRNLVLINHITGLGFAFAGNSLKSFFLKSAILSLYQISAVLADKLIVQNPTDFRIINKLCFASSKLIIIEGSGVDQDKFSKKNVDEKSAVLLQNQLNINPEDTIITFTGRLLVEKGITEFLEVADELSIRERRLKFCIAGWFDINNPSCISSELLDKYQSNINIKFLGFISEIRELLYLTDIFVLPTYREGFPRSVLEAMSMSLAVITTDVPGSRDAVTNNFNGLIINAGDKEELETAILRLVYDRELCMKMGNNGRTLVENKFNNQVIYNKILDVYEMV